MSRFFSPQPSALSPQPSAYKFSLIYLKRFLANLACILIYSISSAHAVETGYHPFNETGAYPQDTSAQLICIGSRCYMAYDSSQIFTNGEAACNAVLNAKSSDGRKNFSGYSYPDFSLKSWGSPYTDFVGNTYSANQCILNSTGNGFTFTISCGFGIFGTCWYPNFEARQMVRCPVTINGVDFTYWFRKEDAVDLCTTASIILTLTPVPQTPPDPRPAGTGGKSTLELKAMVTENGSPKKDVVVGFGVAAEPFSGGHPHGDLGRIPRPKGKLDKTSDRTDTNGEIKLTFTADQPAGLHTIVADCTPAGCAATAKYVVKVKVPDLIHIPPDYGSTPPKYVLIGNYKPVGGATEQINHNDTHFLTEQSWANLKDLIKTFARLGWGQVGINDASLEWGGMFDIEGKWLDPVLRSNGKSTTGGHAEHRDGKQVDLSFVRPASVSDALRQKAYDEICEAEGAELPQILWHKNDGYPPHFHVYLTGKVPPSAKAKVCN